MSPKEIETHNKVRRDLAFGLGRYLEKFDLDELLVDGVMFVNE